MEILPQTHHYTSHPAHKRWDRVPHTENDDLLNEETKKLIKGLSTSINNSNKEQHTYATVNEEINTYTPKYQQFAREAERNIDNKKCVDLLNKDFSENREIKFNETGHSDFHQSIQSLEKLNAEVILGKRKYIAKGEEKFEQFEFPSHDSFKGVRPEEKELAKQKQDEYLAVNTNIQLSLQQGLERMDTSLTTTEEFKSIQNLVNQGNLKEDREEISNFIDSLHASLQDHSSNAALQKEQIHGYLEENQWLVAKQMSKANQRFKDAEDYLKIAREELKNYKKMVNNLEEPLICDTYAQAKKRVEQTRERAKSAEGHYKEADERAKKASKRVEQAKKLGLKDAIEAAEKSLHCAKEVASLARKLAADEHILAKNIDEWAKKLRSNTLSHNPEEETKFIREEQKFIEDSKKFIESIKHKQKEETDILQKEISILQNSKIDNRMHQNQNVNASLLSESQIKRIDKLKGLLSDIEKRYKDDPLMLNTSKKQIEDELQNIIVNAIKNPDDVIINNSILSSVKSKEIVDHSKSATTQIDKDILTIGKSSEIFEKQGDMYNQIDIYHKSLASSHSTIDQTHNSYENYAIQSEQAKIRSEQHEISKKQAEDRYKHYNKRELQLTDQHLSSRAVQQAALYARIIIQYADSLHNAENSIAEYAKQAAESTKKIAAIEKDRDGKDQKSINMLSNIEDINITKKNISDAKLNITKWTSKRDGILLKMQKAYKQELSAIKQDTKIVKDTFNAAKDDLETLANLRKYLDMQEVPSKFPNDSIEKFCKSLERNLRYMEYKSHHDLNSAIELVNTMDTNFINKHAEDIISGSEAHIPICNSRDGEKWIFVKGLCMNIKELRNLKIDAKTGETQIQWREDATKLSIFGSKKFSKRISAFHLDTDHKTLTLEAPGNDFKRGLGENERSVWKVTNNGEEKVYDAETLDGIEVALHQHKEGKDEVSIQTAIKTMPKGTINHDDLFNGYSRLHVQCMNRINAKSGEFIGQNNKFRKKMSHFDFTETTNVAGVGLLLNEDATNRSTHPDSIVKVDRMLNNANNIEDETKAKIIEYAKYSKELLKDAIVSQSRDKIQQIIRFLEQNEALAASETAAMNYRLQNAPKDIYEVRELKATSKTYFKRLSDRQNENSKELFQSKNSFNNKVKLFVSGLYSSPHSLSKEQAREVIHATYRLKKHNFQLLVDPNRDGEVKCSHPDSLMLIEEWELYAHKDLSEPEKAYQQRIENFIMENCHAYWKNHMTIMKAANHAAKGDNGLNDAVKSLQVGLSLESDAFDSSYTATLDRVGKETFASLDKARSHDEKELVHYLTKAFSQVRTEGVDQLLYGYLSIAKHMQQSKLHALRAAQYALKPSTLSKDALHTMEAIQKDELPASTYQEIEKPTKLQQINDEIKALVHRIPSSIPEGKSPQEFAVHVSSALYDFAILRHNYIIESIDDPHLKQSLEQHAEDHIKSIHQNTMKIYKLEFKKRETQELEDLKQKNRREMAREQFYKNLLYALIVPWQQGTQAMNNASTTAGTSIWRAITSIR